MYSFRAEQWAGQDFQSQGHSIRVKGQQVKMTQQRTGPMSG